MKELASILNHVAQPAGGPWALATLVSVAGSSYRRPGARLLADACGPVLGSISGGCLEADVAERARAVLATGRAQAVSYDTTLENDLVWGVGLGCQGVVQVFLEPLDAAAPWLAALRRNFNDRRETGLATVWAGADAPLLGTHEGPAARMRLPPEAKVFEQIVPPPLRLLVFGAGDDAQPLVRLAAELGWRVEVCDPRPAYARAERFPAAASVVAMQPAAAAHLPVDPWTVAVVLTHRYAFDVDLLRALLPRGLPYLGLLGPRKRTERILDEIGTPAAQREHLHAPVGLDLGGDTPEAVALAIVAEIQAALAHRDGRPLRERAGPIHAAS